MRLIELTDIFGVHMAEAQQIERAQIDDDRLGDMHLQLLEDLWDDRELNAAQKMIEGGQVAEGMDALITSLKTRRDDSPDQEWAEYKVLCRNHPVCKLIHEDPFTWRTFNKPRGYAGDAVMMDMIYLQEAVGGHEQAFRLPEETTDLGRELYKYTSQIPACKAVQARRDAIADMIDKVAEDIREPHVFSIAAGHMREADLSRAIRRRKLGRLVALDSDAESLEEIHRSYGDFGVEVMAASVRRLLNGSLETGEFDFVYSMGLFDYLRLSTGQRLVSRMFDMLRPGGRLVVANFLPEIRDVGYMEAFMDWDLLYRTRAEMMELTMKIPQTELGDLRVFSDDETTNILFLEISKPRASRW